MAEAWNGYCQAYVDRVFAVGVAQAADGGVFAGADAAGGTVEKLYKDEYQVTIQDENNNDKQITINEPSILKTAVDTLKATNGIWLGGDKFVVVKTDDALESNGVNLVHIFARSKKGGAHIFKTENGYIVIGMYSEEEPYSQTQNAAYVPAVEFAEWIAQNV